MVLLEDLERRGVRDLRVFGHLHAGCPSVEGQEINMRENEEARRIT